ncbi:MAG: selenium metabolism-associated LysR family transcriptional regulator [Pirellulales bacterium]
MDLRHLQTFIATAEQQNFTRAARCLSLTQAAVSKHIAQLEGDLGVRLFDRQGRTATLTDAGRTLHKYALRIFKLVGEARSEVGGESIAVSGSLKIAASSVPAESLLPALLADFRKTRPEVQVVVSVSDSEASATAVCSGEADVGLIGELPHDGDLMVRPIAEDELVLVAPANHDLSRRKSFSAAQLAAQPLIIRERGSGSRHCVEQHLEAAGVVPSDLNIVMEANSNESIRAAVERGSGIAFQSRLGVPREIDAGRLVTIRLRGLRISRQLYAITHRRRPQPAALAAFLDFLDENRPRRKSAKRKQAPR